MKSGEQANATISFTFISADIEFFLSFSHTPSNVIIVTFGTHTCHFIP